MVGIIFAYGLNYSCLLHLCFARLRIVLQIVDFIVSQLKSMSPFVEALVQRGLSFNPPLVSSAALNAFVCSIGSGDFVTHRPLKQLYAMVRTSLQGGVNLNYTVAAIIAYTIGLLSFITQFTNRGFVYLHCRCKFLSHHIHSY